MGGPLARHILAPGQLSTSPGITPATLTQSSECHQGDNQKHFKQAAAGGLDLHRGERMDNVKKWQVRVRDDGQGGVGLLRVDCELV
jgi:hypothetical protein